MSKKVTGILLFSLLLTYIADAVTWNADVPVGAKWSDGANWSGGTAPLSTDLALFQNAQANTLNVDVDVAGATRLQQVMQGHTFNGSGSIRVTTTADAQFKSVILNTTAGAVTYNVPVSVNVSSANSTYYGQAQNSAVSGSKTVFNGAFTVEAGTGAGINLDRGTFEFNGNLTINDGFRLGSGKTIIGGSGTTLIGGPGYILTSGAGTELDLNRTGAYTLADNVNGSLRLEQTKVVFNAPRACGAGTNVKLYQTFAGDSRLVSGGNYDQNFGYLACYGTNTATDIDMANSACTWTFADSSTVAGWTSLTIASVDASNTVIRFALGSGGGLTAAQIGKITLNGTVLTTGDTQVKDGYLYITPATIPEPATAGLFGLSALGILLYKRHVKAG